MLMEEDRAVEDFITVSACHGFCNFVFTASGVRMTGLALITASITAGGWLVFLTHVPLMLVAVYGTGKCLVTKLAPVGPVV